MKTIAIVGTLDTKGAEFGYLKERIIKEGAKTLVINAGILGDPSFRPEITADEVALAGGISLNELRDKKDRALSNDTMVKGAAAIVRKLYDEGKIDGVVSMGGGQGSNIAAAVMRSLPIGVPKVILSTLATTNFVTPMFRGINDTMVMNTLVDISGLNYMLKTVIAKAAATIVGMVNSEPVEKEVVKPRIGLSMLGITTPCVSRIQEILNNSGFETMVFHANGMGGATMEKLILEGVLQGVLDTTLYEVAANYLKIDGDAGPDRMDAACSMGLPQVICPGSLDIMNFSPPESMPEKYKDREFIMHISMLKVTRTSVEENKIFGKIIADKLNKSKGKVSVILPLKGLSYNDTPGKKFYSPEANKALFDTLKSNLNGNIEVNEKDNHINDPEFADSVADLFINIFKQNKSKK